MREKRVEAEWKGRHQRAATGGRWTVTSYLEYELRFTKKRYPRCLLNLYLFAALTLFSHWKSSVEPTYIILYRTHSFSSLFFLSSRFSHQKGKHDASLFCCRRNINSWNYYLPGCRSGKYRVCKRIKTDWRILIRNSLNSSEQWKNDCSLILL